MKYSHLAQALFAALAASATVACTESTPKQIDATGTLHGSSDSVVPPNEAPNEAPSEALIGGRSFSDTAPMPTAAPAGDGAPTPVGQLDMTGASGGLGAQNASMGSYLNPSLAAGLREDPGQTAAGSIEGLITFGDLSLLGADIDQLLDYIYKPETENAKRFKFPQRILDKAGEDKAIVGYMIALEFKNRSDKLISFMLVRDLQACCFGGIPRPDEWILVEMEEGKTCDQFMYVPITVRGKFIPGRVEDEYGYSSAIFNLEASSVERYAAPKTK